MRPHKILNIPSADANLVKSLREQLGISDVFAQVLINRGLSSPKEIQRFLSAGPQHFLDPYSFKDMRGAVSRIREAVSSKEKVMIFGDYDVDGITSLALLKGTLAQMGLEAEHYLPHRIKDGYGLNSHIVRLAKENKFTLLITTDCGTNDHQHIEDLRRLKVDVIVTDHHELSGPHPAPANFIINPKLKDSSYGYRDLAGVGVAYKLCQALRDNVLIEELDLVCLGTIADVAPLTGENRVIAREGLKRLTQTRRTGLRAIFQTSGLKDKTITAEFVSYIIGPRLNASGRIDHAQTSLNLLLSSEDGQARQWAQAIETCNRRRQKEESKILEEAQDLISREINFEEHKIIVLAKEDWHQGVLGVVASKIADKFYRPTIIISLGSDSCKGSGRSIKNFHLFNALCECRQFLENFGGHSHAAGLMINRKRLEDFKRHINCLADDKLRIEDLLPALDVDMELNFSDIRESITEELEQLRPYGEGNPEPVFYTRNLKVKGRAEVLARNTLKFWASDGRLTYPVIGFGMGDFSDSLKSADALDMAYSLRIDSWQQEGGIILEAKDIFFR